jgi:hypothetical protein
VEPALRDLQLLGRALARDAIDQTILDRDPPRPPSLEIAAQRFGLAGPAERLAQAFLDQAVQPVERVGGPEI